MSTVVPSCDGVKINTKTDDALARTEDLFVCAYRLHNAVNELDSCCKLLEDNGSSANKRKECHRIIRNVISPIMTTVSNVLVEAGKANAPIAGVKYISEKKERARIQDVLDMNSKKNVSLDILMMKSYLQSQDTDESCSAQKRPSPTTPTHDSKRTRSNAVTPTTDEVALRLPVDGKQYSKQEDGSNQV
eukprot:scaffold105890_cov72-Cyclotella_meneghiniana.AAC.2